MIAFTTSAPTHLYIRTDLLKFGDVLLMYSDSPASAAITAATQGRFSHAALVVSGLQVYESTLEKGVGFSTLKKAGWTTVQGQPALLGTLIQNPIDCKVLRHPSLAVMSEEECALALKGFYEKTHGWKYSPLQRMEALVRGNLTRMSPLLEALAVYVDRQDDDPLKRYFCSEVVASFFDCFKLPLFDDGRTPDQVVPSDLESEHSYLVEVPGMVIGAAGLVIEPANAHYPHGDALTSNDVLDIQHRDLNSVARLHQMMAESNRRFDSINQELQSDLRMQCLQQMNLLPEEFDKFCSVANYAIKMLDPALAHRAVRYTKRLGLKSIQLLNEGDLSLADSKQLAAVAKGLKEVASSKLRMSALLWSAIFRVVVSTNSENLSLRVQMLEGRTETLTMARKALLDSRKV